MKHVGIFEAKTHLSSLLEEVEKGGEIVITRHGKPVAKLVQPGHASDPSRLERRKLAVQRLRRIANELKINPTHAEIKGWINEGRR
jgi:prevent-host-death family protein